jgi:spore coat polysaccharide biosynthesis predicted glycosyltransferase SpsG
MNMKVRIFTEGGADIGFGHIARCLSLYQAFEEKGIKPLFVVNGDKSVYQYLKNTRHELVNWLEKDPSAFLADADIVIVDSYLAGSGFYDKVSKAAKVPVYLDDNKRLDYPKGVVVNGTIFAEELGYPDKNNITYLLGSRYIPLRKTFWNLPAKEVKKDIQSVLISFGGDDSRNLTPVIAASLKRNFPEYRLKIIIGSAFKYVAQIESLKNSNTKLIYSPGAEGMKQAMIESDMAISAAGQTLYEFARVGLPVIAIAVVENQMNNVRGWLKAGFIEYAGWWEEHEIPSKISASIRLLEDRDIRQLRSTTGRKLVDGRGAGRIAEEILRKI